MEKFDVVILGAGSAGLSARREVAKKTDKYLVVDPGPLGTTCARVGCMPSKVLIQVAHDYHRRHKLAEQGIIGSEGLTLDSAKVMQHVRALRDRFVRGVMGDMADWQSTHYREAYAKFTNDHQLELSDGSLVEAEAIVIATGSTPVMPEAWKSFHNNIWNTDTFFEQSELPKSVAVIGLGVIGLELGLALAHLGVKVTGIARSLASLGGITDPDLLKYARRHFQKDIPILIGDAELSDGQEGRVRVQAGSEHVDVDRVMLTMGRRANVKGFGLEGLGLEYDDSGRLKFNPHTYQLSIPHLYFVGDVNEERAILHEASDEGRIAGYNAVRKQVSGYKRRVKMGVVFSKPEILAVGQSWRDLTETGVDFVKAPVSYEGQGRAIVMLEEVGFGHLYAEKNTGIFLGAEILAPHGDQLAHLLAWAIEKSCTVDEILSFPFYHPVLEEGLRTGFRDLARQLTVARPKLEMNACE